MNLLTHLKGFFILLFIPLLFDSLFSTYYSKYLKWSSTSNWRLRYSCYENRNIFRTPTWSKTCNNVWALSITRVLYDRSVILTNYFGIRDWNFSLSPLSREKLNKGNFWRSAQPHCWNPKIAMKVPTNRVTSKTTPNRAVYHWKWKVKIKMEAPGSLYVLFTIPQLN